MQPKYVMILFVALLTTGLGFWLVNRINTNYSIIEEKKFPDYNGKLSDHAQLISDTREEIIRDSINQFMFSTFSELAICTVETTDTSTINDYARELLQRWRIGQRYQNNGYLMLISKSEGEIAIVSRKAILNHEQARKLIHQHVNPHISKGNYEKGIMQSISALSYMHNTNEQIQPVLQNSK